jgi:hypothetical protein
MQINKKVKQEDANKSSSLGSPVAISSKSNLHSNKGSAGKAPASKGSSVNQEIIKIDIETDIRPACWTATL